MQICLKKFFYISLGLLLTNYSSAVTVNGKELTSLINPDQTLCCSIDASGDFEKNISLLIKDGNIEVRNRKIENIEDIKAYFYELEEKKGNLYQNSSQDTVSMKSGKSLSLSGAYFSGNNNVILEAGDTIDVSKAILKSKKVTLGGSKLKIKTCYIDTDTLQVKSSDPKSLIKTITFKLDKNVSIPVRVEGEIDFTKNEILEHFLVIGATEVEIQFSPKAFEKI